MLRVLLTVVLLFVLTACSTEPDITLVGTAEPTSTTPPTKTPTPHVIPVATDETELTVTAPSATMEPTHPPAPTTPPTLEPTAAPTPTFLPITLTLGCDDGVFIQDIIDLSEDQEHSILKIYAGSEEVRRSAEILECRGEAKLSIGDVLLSYYYQIDRDGDSFYGYVVDEYIPTPTPPATPTSVHTPTPQPPPALGSRENPVPLGDLVQVDTPGFGQLTGEQWEVAVLETYPDAWEAIHAENPYNYPPEPGTQFYMVLMRIKQVGPDSATFLGNSIYSVGDGGVAYDDGCGIMPDELDVFTELFTGGQLEGNVCWQVATEDVDSLMMFIDFGHLNEVRVWFDLS